MRILISMLAIVTLANSQTLSQPYYYQTTSTGPNSAKIERFNLQTQTWETFIADHHLGLETLSDPTQTWAFASYRGGMNIIRANDTLSAFHIGSGIEVLGVVFAPQPNRFYITWQTYEDSSSLSVVYDADTFAVIDTLSEIEFYFGDAISSDGLVIYGFMLNGSTNYQEVTKFSTQTNTVVERISLQSLGPPTEDSVTISPF